VDRLYTDPRHKAARVGEAANYQQYQELKACTFKPEINREVPKQQVCGCRGGGGCSGTPCCCSKGGCQRGTHTDNKGLEGYHSALLIITYTSCITKAHRHQHHSMTTIRAAHCHHISTTFYTPPPSPPLPLPQIQHDAHSSAPSPPLLHPRSPFLPSPLPPPSAPAGPCAGAWPGPLPGAQGHGPPAG
jgi:hypothetical protein